jgi:outer membrane receptor for ferrienterochelin and colicins
MLSMKNILILLFSLLIVNNGFAQLVTISGNVSSKEEPIEFANLFIKENERGTVSDENGFFEINRIRPGNYTLRVTYIGFKTKEIEITVNYGEDISLEIEMEPLDIRGNEIVVTGTLKEISRSKSPVPVEVFSPAYFKMNPTPSLYDAMQNVNGVRPQLNCSVCNTGDIHINGLEGPYTMVLIDGMPIVSGLSTVYGLSGIPNSMIERVEIVKGPASTLYGSEAVGGLINVITKKPSSAPTFLIEGMSSNWLDLNLDLGGKFKVGENADVLTGVNMFNYTNPIDNNNDGFTDVTIQERYSIFQKWAIQREEGRLFTIAGRYLFEDRWGGKLDWDESFKGGTEIYGENIVTNRWELIGNYQLPTTEKLLLSVSYNNHYQDSYYGDTHYEADQRIGFAQLTWDTEFGSNSIVAGTALRYTYYDDNTPATASATNAGVNKADEVWLPGIFVQNDVTLSESHQVLVGMRYDNNSRHGNIWTPRFAYKWSPNEKNTIRFNAGTGFRVVNLFTEDHAALTGAREVIIEEELSPERSINANLNYTHRIYADNGRFIGIDASAWYTYFDNQIIPNYETNSNQIIYDNLDGFGVTQGFSVNLNFEFADGIKLMTGASYIDVFSEENDVRSRPILTEEWTGTWALGIPIKNTGVTIDYTGNLYGPMRLPVLNDMDPRSSNSPWWSLQNIHVTWDQPNRNYQVYFGVKNLLNFTPPSNSIARSFDPFDRDVSFDANGEALPTAGNPNALTFDPSYVYAPNQGIRGFIGIRYMIQ